jgi:hypothetical protein
MKKIFNCQAYIFLFSFIMLSLTRAIAFAQDSAAASGSSTQSTTTTTEQTTTVPPWVWIVGGAVLLLIVIALVRGKGSAAAHTDKVTYTKTTSSEDNP